MHTLSVRVVNSHDDGERISEFWKSWNAKFRRNVNKNVVVVMEGCQSDKDITNKFTLHFYSVHRRNGNKSSESPDSMHIDSSYLPLRYFRAS
jgi:hypothetical protein